MAVDFFGSEVMKVRNRFAAVYQGRDVYNLEFRGNIILAIVGLGILEREISITKDKEDIKRFIRNRDIIMNALLYAEEAFQAMEKAESESAPTAEKKAV